MAEDWSAEEVAATVADYFVMLACELRGVPYNKREHNRRLQSLLRGRTAGAIEFKHGNISAALEDLGIPSIEGYKQRSNYQGLLRNEAKKQFEGDDELRRLVASAVHAPVTERPVLRSLSDIIVSAPVPERRGVYERRVQEPIPALGINYLEREAQNSSLGNAGELFAAEIEHRRLWEAGCRELAERIEHVSRTRGDGLGYDILSFETDGRERMIEVKTTRFGVRTPFFASRREVAVSEREAARYSLYRVFGFSEAPRMFVLPGSLRESCSLDPVQYRATVG